METIINIAKNGKGLAQQEAVTTANRTGVRLLSNREFDRRLVLTDTWKGERGAYPAWSTLVAFKSNEGDGKGLGDVIKYTDPLSGVAYVFEVPEQYRKESNAILVLEHGFVADGRPTFSFAKDGKDVYVDVADKGKIELLPCFPSTDGWYATDKKFGIPLGGEISPSDPAARFLWRAKGYVGLLARGWDCAADYCGRRNVVAGLSPSRLFGALAATEKTAEPCMKIAMPAAALDLVT